jgi:hypothetical protein
MKVALRRSSPPALCGPAKMQNHGRFCKGTHVGLTVFSETLAIANGFSAEKPVGAIRICRFWHPPLPPAEFKRAGNFPRRSLQHINTIKE